MLFAPLVLILAACGGSDDRKASRSDSGVDRPLILGYASELQGLNPIVSTDQNANELIYYLLFTPLVTYDAEFRPAPSLARSWVLTDTSVVFNLRDDLLWHDGTPVTARDVAFTFRRAKDPAAGSPLAAAYLANVASVEVLGDYEVLFRFTAPHSEPLEDFFWPPAPAHLLQDIPASELLRAPYNRSPVGNGPYRFVRWDVNQQLVFEANPDYPLALGGPPTIRSVVYRIIPDQTTMLAELMSGGIQVDGPLAPSDAARVEQTADLQLLSFPWRQFAYIGWNTRRPQFADPDVRRALTLAIDRESLVRTVLEGHGTPAFGPIPPWHRYAPAISPLARDPDAARALLEAAGWRDEDGDGIRERGGARLSFELLANQRNPIYGDIAQILQADLRAVGVEVHPRLLEWQTVLSMHRGREFDAVLTNWVLDNFRVDPRPLFHGDQVKIANSANRSSYSNPVADSLMDLGARTMDDDAAREIWAEFSRVLQADQPVTFLFWQDELAGIGPGLSGVTMDARGELATLPRWSWADEGKQD
ncbi:MAG: ABC transporter substrate-binding protein [Gemmatimonadota bacterium]|nr:ABC transporter substrate-binding protein [Gemmatimonadota bacterium]